MINFRLMLAGVAAGFAVACSGGEAEPTPAAAIPTRPGPTTTSAPTAVPTTAATARPSAMAPTATATSPISTPSTTAAAGGSPQPAPQPTSVPQPTAPPPPTAPPQPAARTLTFKAVNDTTWDRQIARVKAGTTLTAIMDNVDPGVEHNLSFSLPGLPHGDTCAGPCTATQVFRADTPGSYFFLCTIHDMSGPFIVE